LDFLFAWKAQSTEEDELNSVAKFDYLQHICEKRPSEEYSTTLLFLGLSQIGYRGFRRSFIILVGGEFLEIQTYNSDGNYF
jgi:hypothetical protein